MRSIFGDLFPRFYQIAGQVDDALRLWRFEISSRIGAELAISD
jgi:hypothetical protein